MKSSMMIEVEFMAGTAIKDAISEAIDKAKKLDIAYVQFNFNGTSFSIGRNAVLDEVMEDWKSRKNNKYGIIHY